MKKNYKACLLGLFVTALAWSQKMDTQKLDLYFQTLEANNKFMGSVAISQNGQRIYTKTVGFADVENKLKANENSKYRIGSISKTFTSILVFKAIENKKLTLNQTIEMFFPTIPNAGKITIGQLLSHRSGLHDFTDDDDYYDWNTKTMTEKEMVAGIAKGGTDFEPDTKAEYCNSNYVLLTYILEKTFQKKYSDLLKNEITQPLGMKNTYLGGKINTQNNECKSYNYEGNWKVRPETDISIPMGAGGIVSTPGDLLKLSEALFKGKLLKKESVEAMKTIQDKFGKGLFRMPFNDKIGYGHAGNIDGFNNTFTYYSDGDFSFAMTSNGTNYSNNTIALTALQAIFKEPFAIPEFTTYTVKPEDLDQYLGTYASTEIPVKMTVVKENGVLQLQTPGQPTIALEAAAKDQFKFEKAGVVLEFNPTEKTMLLKQRGGAFRFTKE
ncbi:serine hydrolase domain-containing protein [Flavobacterium cerinum]|uniref:Beta-lactamase family protein n=1 Tax=Flavobacterium cerinum TaxID=2502784 RepID=A0ABY5IQS7_9FLAO|nr:serine hydrolase domain-containing protein [Flavobacterium cerinum]UUC45173.1 beta-lactamase family protein [Flavobacterium cerinum]